MPYPTPLASPPMSALAPERRAQELLLEFLQRFFTGTPHFSALGDRLFPRCDVLFGDAVAPLPGERPQIHGVLMQKPACLEWWSSTDASAWGSVLAVPASGVAYGRNAQEQIEETVHGRLRRTLPGTDIRWRAASGQIFEETLQHGTWTAIRTIPADALAWVRDGGAYVEQARPSYTELRRFSPENPEWDGDTLRVHGDLRIQWFVRVLSAGEADSGPDHRCREVADALTELFQRRDATVLLAESGLARWGVGNVNLLSTPGVVVRTLATVCAADYLQPLA